MSGTCATSRADRGLRAVAAVFLIAIATTTDNPWCAVPAALCATFLIIGAITGWCPTDLLRRPEPRRENAFGYRDARDVIDR